MIQPQPKNIEELTLDKGLLRDYNSKVCAGETEDTALAKH